jgi:hypothetical protein
VRNLIFLWLIFSGTVIFAQEPLMPLLPEKDSTMLETERKLMYHQLLSGISPLGDLMQPLQLPEFDFRGELAKRWSYDFSGVSTNQWTMNGFMPGHFGLASSPFLRGETVFSGAVYQLNDRFTLGGYSYGANSVFTAPFPNQGINNFDFRGSTLFLKYNVSKNFKIETRVNVTHGPGY